MSRPLGSRLLAFILVFATLQASASPLVCSDLFDTATDASTDTSADVKPDVKPEPTTVELQLRPMDLTFEPGAPSKSDSLSALLEMYLSMPFQGEGVKDYAKGTLRLARELPNGESLEFKYKADQRTGELVFRLSEISRIYKNGFTESIEKRPLTNDGISLRSDKMTLPIDDPASLEHVHFEPLAVPIEIKGEILKALKAWMDRFPLLSIEDARKAITQSSDVVPIVSWQASFKSGLILFGKTTKKQAFKAFLYAIVFVGVQQIPNVGALLQYLPGYGRVDRLLRGEKNDAGKAQEEILRSVLSSGVLSTSGSTAEVFAIENRFSAELTKEKDHRPSVVAKAIQQISIKLIGQEKKAGGKAVVFVQDIGGAKAVNIQRQIETAGGRSLMIELFAKQNRILLIPIVRLKDGASVPSMIQITRKESPRTFAGLEAMIHKQTTSQAP